ncbi:MAG TPA: FIST C-terminal domain-containing protein [Geminicoccaceae bacterium]|nr:FIST C-terminal domain-containing protein [Geminicoccaceae bacterium]
MQAFRAAEGEGGDWLAACRACVERLGPLPPSANLGFVYANAPLAGSLDLIAARLRDATGVRDWVGAGGAGVCASGQEHFEGGAIVALVAALPERAFRLFDLQLDGHGDGGRSLAEGGRTGTVGLGVVHAAASRPDIVDAIAGLSEATDAFLVGGLASAGDLQIAGQPTEGALSGVLLDAAVPVITGLSQGCTPIGPVREVTECRGPWIKTLDRRPALAVLKEDIGEVLARDLRKIDGFVQAAIPLVGSDRADYLVRNLLGVDTNGGMVAVGEELRRGDRLMFVKRDGGSAQADLRRMLHDLLRRAEGRTVRGALYHSCIARGPHMFGPDSAELRAIEAMLGPVPLAGFFTNGEIFRNRLYSYTGVLTLFL